MKPIGNERGTALVLSLLVMAVLTIFALVATNQSGFGLRHTADFKARTGLLYLADGGTDYAARLLNRAVANGNSISATDSGAAAVTINATDTDTDGITDLEDEIAANDAANSDSYTDTQPDVTVTIADSDVKIDLDYIRNKKMPGASSEFASRYEGIGAGGAGGNALYYRLDGNVTSGERSKTVRAWFRCVEGGGRCL